MRKMGAHLFLLYFRKSKRNQVHRNLLIVVSFNDP
jgi:hypothetical protein